MGNPSPSAPPLPLRESLLGQDQKQHKGFDPQQQVDAGYIDPYPPPLQYPGLGEQPNPNPNPSPAVVLGFPAPPPPVLQPWRPPPPPQAPPLLPAPPQHHRRQDGATSRWSSGLCSCCADPGVCLVGCCCPCVLFGRVASTLDQADADADADADAADGDGGTHASHDGTMMTVDTSSCSAPCLIWYVLQQFTGLGWIYSCGYRAKLQTRLGIRPHHGTNCILHLCCSHCAFCQEYRELKTRRRRELERRQPQQQPIMIPPLAQSMMHHG